MNHSFVGILQEVPTDIYTKNFIDLYLFIFLEQKTSSN